ncbi:MAG: hypothetical protein ABWZ80_04390 [Beijerinckiaceae bacterium]
MGWSSSDLKFVKGADASISQWIGISYDELIKVVELLNKVPPGKGGPTTPIPLPNKHDPLLGFSPMAILGDFFKAIEKFQTAQFGSLTDRGVLTPSSATLLRLANLATPGDGSLYAVAGTKRAEALRIANNENELVGDVGGGTRGERKAWTQLKRYFDESLLRPLPWSSGKSSWAPLKFTDKAGVTHQLETMLEGVQRKGMRVPQSNKAEVKTRRNARGETETYEYWRGVSWCGIFANWAWQAAGVGTKWQMGVGPTVNGVKVAASSNVAALSPGDIVIKKGGEVHHALVAVVKPGGKDFLTIDGNTYEAGMDQTVARHSISAGDISYFYSMDSALAGGKAAF